MRTNMAARAATAAAEDASLQSAICFARQVCHVEVRIARYEAVLSLWRAGHSHTIGSTDSAELSLWPKWPLLAILQRPADGAPARLYVARELLLAGQETRLAVVRLAADLSARSEIAGWRGRLQVCALLATPGVRYVEQYPRPRILAA